MIDASTIPPLYITVFTSAGATGSARLTVPANPNLAKLYNYFTIDRASRTPSCGYSGAYTGQTLELYTWSLGNGTSQSTITLSRR